MPRGRIYAEINARILAGALKMGSVVYLNESDAAKIAKTNVVVLNGGF